MKRYELILVDNPAGTYSFVGSVPIRLGYIEKDGSELTDDSAAKLAWCGMPSLVAKVRVFKTILDAVNAVERIGITSYRIVVGDRANKHAEVIEK